MASEAQIFWTPARVAVVRKLIEEDCWTADEVGSLFGRSRTSIHRICSISGIHCNRTGRQVRLMKERRSGNRFWEARMAKGWSVEEAAWQIGVSERTILNWETGRSKSPYYAKYAADAYGVSAAWLVGEEGYESVQK